MRPELAIIYWFYKEPEITRNHLELLKKHNPDSKIFGVYGGDLKEAADYEKALGDLLDDFWAYPETYGAEKFDKWIHGDLMLLDWYDKRGRDLEWDSVAVTQWDMLVFNSIHNILPGLKKNQLYFAGYRTISKDVENRWTWTRPDGKHRTEYEAFCRYVADKYGWHEQPKACLFIFEVLTREFFEKYLEIDDKKIGMLEYKDPTLAVAWGLDIYKKDLGVFWQDWYTKETAALIALGNTYISEDFIREQLGKADGWRIFHPYHGLWEY